MPLVGDLDESVVGVRMKLLHYLNIITVAIVEFYNRPLILFSPWAPGSWLLP